MDQIKKAIITEYWVKKLTGELPKISLPFIANGGEEETVKPAVRSTRCEIQQPLAEKLFKSSKNSDKALFILFLSGINIVMSKYTGSDDVVVGTLPPAADGDDGSIIFCRTRICDGWTNKDLITRTRDEVLEAMKFKGFSLDEMVGILKAKSNTDTLDIFNAAFLYEPFQARRQSIDRFDLVLVLTRQKNRLGLQVELSTCSLDMLDDMARNVIITLDRMLANTSMEIAMLDILNPGEKNRLLYEFNRTEAGYPGNKTIQLLFEEQVERTPDQVALVGPTLPVRPVQPVQPVLPVRPVQLTYTELDEQSDRLAGWLIEKGVLPDTIVAIMIERSVDMIAGILGILKTGGAYMPIDPEYPRERIDYMLKDSGTVTVVSDRNDVGTGHCPVLILDFIQVVHDESGLRTGQYPVSKNPFIGSPRRGPCQVGPANLAYIIYTSGSTGKPKGVMVAHGNVVNYICWAIKKYTEADGNAGNQRFPLFTPLSFDLTVTSIFVPLLSGNTMVLYPEERQETLIGKIIGDHRLGVMKLTPSHFKLLMEQAGNTPGSSTTPIKSGIKGFILGGEALETRLARGIIESVNENPAIYNEYGPTEATVGAMIYRYSPGTDTRAAVPIGTPIDNVQIYLLDKNMNPVPLGAAGEIYISGEGVARGYLNRPELTDRRFMKNPFLPGKRMYKTGDLARVTVPGGGIIEFLGRIDRQVKIRGFRIESEEIQHRLIEYKKHAPMALAAADFDAKVRKLKTLQHCTRCLLPVNYPGIRIDRQGVCSICREYEKYKDKVNMYFKNKEDFERLIEETKKSARGEYDCLLLFSGGKDSTYVLYRLMEMGLKVLTFTFDNGFISEAAFANIKRTTEKLGVDHITGRSANMNRVFLESLNINHNVCHGCWNALNAMGTQIADEKGIDLVISGLSRGQIFEMRLEGLFQRGIFAEKEIEENLLLFRKAFHSQINPFSRILDIRLAEEVVERIRYVDFFRYFTVAVPEIKDYLSARGWIQPGDTGFCSSNCLVNDVGIYVYLKKEGQHFYAPQLSWDCRLGSISREQGLKETGFACDLNQVDRILKEIGYYRSPVKNAVVMDKENQNGERYLVAYMVTEEELSVSELGEYLSAQLPGYMVPSHFMRIDRIPLTENGKIDVKALEALSKPIIPDIAYTPPGDEIERAVADIWRQVLRLEKVGIHNNYFELGGTSFDILRINQKLKEHFEMEIPVVTMFRYTTVHTLAGYLKNETGEMRDRSSAFERGKKDKIQRLRMRKGVRNQP